MTDLVKNFSDAMLNRDAIKALALKEAKKKDSAYFNISRLLEIKVLKHSESIRFGNYFEKRIKVFLTKELNKKGVLLFEKDKLLEIKETYKDETLDVSKSVKKRGRRDIDICYMINGVVYYFELKSNWFLDTEKIRSTHEKIEEVKLALSRKFNAPVVGGLLSIWYEIEDGMIITSDKKNEVFFMKHLFYMLNVDNAFTKDKYYTILKKLGVRYINFKRKLLKGIK